MENRKCTACGETFPATLEYFYKKLIRKDGSVRLRAKCKSCHRKFGADWREKNPEYYKDYYVDNIDHYRETNKRHYIENIEYHRAYSKRWRQENYEYSRLRDKKNYEKRRLAEGKQLGVKTPATNFYVGYVVLESGTYFKPGITSCDSMEDRYKKVPTSYGKVVGVQETDFWRFDTEDEARAMEREFLSHCRTFMGEPTMGREWWEV